MFRCLLNGTMSKQVIIWVQVVYSSPPPPPLPKNHGVPMLVPHHRSHPILGKGYTPLSRYWLPLVITKNTPFAGFSREIFPRLQPKNTPLSRENGNTHAAPSCIRVGGRGCIECREEHERLETCVGILILICIVFFIFRLKEESRWAKSYYAFLTAGNHRCWNLLQSTLPKSNLLGLKK